MHLEDLVWTPLLHNHGALLPLHDTFSLVMMFCFVFHGRSQTSRAQKKDGFERLMTCRRLSNIPPSHHCKNRLMPQKEERLGVNLSPNVRCHDTRTPPPLPQEVGGEDVEFLLRDDLTPELVPELTHYEILGFEKYGNGVGDEGLKKAYRKAVLKYHPDKTGVQDGEEDEVGDGTGCDGMGWGFPSWTFVRAYHGGRRVCGAVCGVWFVVS